MHQVNGFTFCVQQDLMKQAAPITVDVSYMGFVINSSLQLSGGGCSSGSCSTC